MGMARPRSDERRIAILDAATSVIATHGLTSAATSAIAKEAGVSNGSLFVYFDSKADLLNELYALLKFEMGQAAFANSPELASPREQLHHMWVQWLTWATSNPDKRRTLAQLEVADDITPETQRLVRDAQRDMAALLERCRENGPLAAGPIGFVLVIIGGIADATMDLLIRSPSANSDRSEAAFEAVWRVLAG
jgi:AcrR family transcriptional regulator